MGGEIKILSLNDLEIEGVRRFASNARIKRERLARETSPESPLSYFLKSISTLKKLIGTKSSAIARSVFAQLVRLGKMRGFVADILMKALDQIWREADEIKRRFIANAGRAIEEMMALGAKLIAIAQLSNGQRLAPRDLMVLAKENEMVKSLSMSTAL